MLLVCLMLVMFAAVVAQEQASRVNRPKNRPPHQQWSLSGADNVRCFCNLPRCVATGYLCKSNRGCFSDFELTRFSSGRHGCMEFLTESQQGTCLLNLHNPRAGIRSSPVCCTNDLCNHVDSPNAKILLNNTLGEEEAANKQQGNSREELLYSNSEVWFRAATIAVPICGAVILFVLIALAVKILKKEHQDTINGKLSNAMYVHVPSHQRSPRKWNSQKYNQYVCRNPFYSQAFVVTPEEQKPSQIQVPLLTEKKNSLTSHSANFHRDLSADCLKFEIEKDLIRLDNNPNITENSIDKLYPNEKNCKS
ncbi:BMP and activin membrane-bound inhibitor homolog [Rhynchophorus ferrugineus]|uniref:BMP and activin membrane-bound inhibitor homolog n=1 Tax=Rhynchophorus ferrugineus TaxID=354439 RepID=UPI003FCE0363